MRPGSIIMFLTVILIFTIILTGCITIRLKENSTTQPTTTELIIAEWSMLRTGIEPNLPVPVIFINQVISEKATWKFQRVNEKLTLRCDGNDTWYKTPLGISVNKKQTTVNETMGKAPYVFTGGGTIDLNQASAIISQMIGQKIEQINAEFSDEIAVSFVQGNNSKIHAVISVDASGKYYGETELGGMKWKTLQQSMTITYEGTKK